MIAAIVTTVVFTTLMKWPAHAAAINDVRDIPSTTSKKNGDDIVKENNPCSVTRHGGDVIVDCSSRSLAKIPPLPIDSTVIKLNDNQLVRIYSNVFQGMVHLKSLDLSGNTIMYFSRDLFKGLIRLERLSLEIVAYSMFEQTSVFDINYMLSDLIQLKDFKLALSPHSIHFQKNCHATPTVNASILANIEKLEIDTSILPSITISSSRKMTKDLTLINHGSYCVLRSIDIKDLSWFPNLQQLTIKTTVSKSYTILQNNLLTHHLHLEEMSIYICTRDCVYFHSVSDDIMYNVTASVSEFAAFRRFSIYEKCEICKREPTDDDSFLSNLKASTSLQTIAMRKIALNFKDVPPSSVLSSSIIRLDVSDNCLSGFQIFQILYENRRIEYIDARIQDLKACDFRYDVKADRKLTVEPYILFSASHLRELSVSHCVEQCDKLLTCPTFHYPNLTHLQLSWFQGCNKTRVKDFTFQHSPALEVLDLTGSGIPYISTSSFRELHHLKTLRLASNKLGKMNEALANVLRNLSSLERIDISNNSIKILNGSVFVKMHDLQFIDVSHNRLTQDLPSLKHLGNLSLLNISYNPILYLPISTRNELDALGKTGNLKVDFTGTHILCNCDSVDFLKWVESSKYVMYNDSLVCHGSKVRVDDMEHVIATLKSKCAWVKHTVMYVAFSVLGVLILIVIISGIVYRFRWKLRFLYHMTKFKYSDTDPEYERLFDYDAFISYASDDFEVARNGCIEHLETSKGLRLLLHERDFKAGQRIGYNISVGIHSSKRTVLFLSANFLGSEWCMYELNIAREEAIRSKRSVMLIVVLESAVIDKASVEIVDLLRTVTYLEYPENGTSDQHRKFWGKLADFIMGK